MQSKGHLQGQIQDLRQGVSNVNSVCVLVLACLRGFVLMILSEMSSSSKRNNLDLYDPIGGLSEHGDLREPHTRNPSGSATEQHHDKLLLVILKYHL